MIDSLYATIFIVMVLICFFNIMVWRRQKLVMDYILGTIRF